MANERYFGTGPYLKRATFRYIPDANALYTQFRTGQIDARIGIGILANFYKEARTLPDRRVFVVPNASIEMILVNQGLPMLAERAVREALYSAINERAIVDVIYEGVPAPAETYTPRESWAYNPDLPPHRYDIARANRLLDEADSRFQTFITGANFGTGVDPDPTVRFASHAITARGGSGAN